MKKILEDTPPGNRTSYTVYMAREEYEGCQAVFRYRYTVGAAHVEVSEPLNGKGEALKYEVFAEHCVPTVYSGPFFLDPELNGKAANYPDALKPLDDEIPLYSNVSTCYSVCCKKSVILQSLPFLLSFPLSSLQLKIECGWPVRYEV